MLRAVLKGLVARPFKRLRKSPDVQALRLRARAAQARRDFAGAEADYRAALALKPDDPETAVEAAKLMYELNRFEEALDLAAAAARVCPDAAAARHWQGLMLRELGRYEESEAVLGAAHAAHPASADISCALALVLADAGRRGEAETLLREVLAREPGHSIARWQLAVLLLSLGRFREGWASYEIRLLRSDVYVRPRALPIWDGTAPPEGPLLVLAEQALGDELLFASCFPDLLDRVGAVIIECDPRLGELFARSFPRARIFAQRNPRAAAVTLPPGPVPAAQIAAGSLPALFRADAHDFPQHCGYLVADPVRVSRWQDRLSALGSGAKIGLSWRGGTAKTRRALRSVPIPALRPLLRRDDVHFVSLQYGHVDEELSVFAELGDRVQHWPEALNDYEETAALVVALDLVITVQTAVAHLAGALGRPVWVMVPASPEWRYLASGSSLPWYPTARLFRQRRVADWYEVISTVGSALDDQLMRGTPTVP